MITSLRANGSHECAPDDRLREAIHRPGRHCERSEAIHLAAQRKNGLLRCARNDGASGKHTFTPSPCHAPEPLMNLSPQEAWGRPDARSTRERSAATAACTMDGKLCRTDVIAVPRI